MHGQAERAAYTARPMRVSSPAVSPSALRTLLLLAWPVVLARATQSVVGFCDALMVAPLGEEALAAATTGALNTYAFIIFPMGTAFIVQSFAAQLRGRGELEATPRYAYYGLLLAVAAQLLALAALPLLPSLIAQLDYTPEVSHGMHEYLAIRLLSVAPAVGIEALGNWFGGLGDTRPTLVAGLLTMIVNVTLNYLLIEPRWGLPGFGVAGAAAASSLATWVGFVAIAALFARVRRGRPGPFQLGLRRAEFVRMLRFGLPNGVNWFLEFAAFLLFINVVVGHLGTTVLAAFNVVLQLNGVSFMPAFGLASAGAIMVGESIGQRAYERVWPLVKLTAQVACAWMGLVGLFYVSSAAWVMAWFRPAALGSEEFLRVGTSMLMLSALWQLCDAIGMTFSEALRAAGDTTWCMLARIVIAWLFFTPLAWTAVLFLEGGVLTVMLSLVGYMLVLSTTLALRFAAGKWRSIDLVGAEPQLV
jgi:multidrug resistance protein, MATE family